MTVGSSVTSLTYDVENRVTAITYPSSATNSFAYNGEDLRTQKVDSSGTKNYVCDGSTPASPVLKDGAAVYTPGLSERRGSASKFLHADALGSTRGITDSTQAVTDNILYDAFGNTLSRTGTTPTPFGFVGASQYQSDSDSSLQLLGHRYYDPSIGRFLSSDPIQDGTNWYAYCDNNPLRKTDAKGLIGEIYDPLTLLIDLVEATTFDKEDDAAKFVIPIFYPIRKGLGVEVGGTIVSREKGVGVGSINFGKPGENDKMKIPLPTEIVELQGIWHTHLFIPDHSNDRFSVSADTELTDQTGIPAYLGQPSGGIVRYDKDRRYHPPNNKGGHGKVTPIGKWKK